MRITDWRPEDRPRERLLAKGAAALGDAELVAVLLRSGVRGKSAVDLAHELITRYGGVTQMLEAGAELETIKGLGPAKRAQFAAAIELARRSLQERLKETVRLWAERNKGLTEILLDAYCIVDVTNHVVDFNEAREIYMRSVAIRHLSTEIYSL